MKTIVTTALSVFTLAVFMQVQGIATEPEDALATPPTPTRPELWNVWSEAEIDGLVWSVRPIRGAEDDDSHLWVEVSMHNPSSQLATGNMLLRLTGENGSPMSRMAPMPFQVDAANLTLQAAAGETVSRVLSFALPETTPSSMSLVFGGSEEEPYSGQGVAAFSSLFGFEQVTEITF